MPSKLLAELVPEALSSVPAVEVSGVCIDSRRVAPGSLFLAVRGKTTDGHRYLSQVAERGAAAAVVETLHPEVPLPQVVVPNVRRSAGHIAARFHDHPCRQMQVYAVTGTNGKTTSAHLGWQLLGQLGHRAAYLGTLGGIIQTESGVIEREGNLTTPEAVDLQAFLGEARAHGCTAAFIEASSAALHQDRLEGCEFAGIAFTNITLGEHLDYHIRFEDYLASKLRLCSYLREEGLAAIHQVSDEFLREVPARLGPERVRVIASKPGQPELPTVPYRIANMTPASTRCWVGNGASSLLLSLPFCAEYNVLNALGAWALVGGPIEHLARLGMPPGRMEPVHAGQPFSVIVDYAHTPDALERILQTMRPLTAGRLICVFGCGGDRDPRKRPEMGRISASIAELTVVTSDNPRSEEPSQIMAEITAGVPAEHRHQVFTESDRRLAIAMALNMAQEGDTVIIAGKGHETYQIIGGTVSDFDDRLVAEEVLRQRFHRRGRRP